jgi:hypothetical protein
MAVTQPLLVLRHVAERIRSRAGDHNRALRTVRARSHLTSVKGCLPTPPHVESVDLLPSDGDNKVPARVQERLQPPD